jgi:tRNA (cytidine32/uridine32-2'-O)-methyltransferase
VNTTHPGNIGAVARAIKNMGLLNLDLVSPKHFPHAESTSRAAGADDVLESARVVKSLPEALKKTQLVIGTSARSRFLPLELLNPREAADKIVEEISAGRQVSIVFGTESSGLSNDDLSFCNYQLYIPSNEEFSSLNLAAAVLVVAYEIRMAIDKKLEIKNNIFEDLEGAKKPSTSEEMELFYKHLQKVLIDIGFFDEKKPRHLMQRLRRIFGRSRPERSEVSILRGVLTAVEKNHD